MDVAAAAPTYAFQQPYEIETNNSSRRSTNRCRTAKQALARRSLNAHDAPSGLASLTQSVAVQRVVDDTMNQYQQLLKQHALANTAAATAQQPASPPVPVASHDLDVSRANGSTSLSSSPLSASSTTPRPLQQQQQPPQQQPPMHSVRRLHASLQSAVGAIQSKTSQLFQAQQHDLLKSFREKLLDVSNQLEYEKRRNMEGSIEWIEACHRLREEVAWLRDLTHSLYEENKRLTAWCSEMREEKDRWERDRTFFVRHVAELKKENARLRFEQDQAREGYKQQLTQALTLQLAASCSNGSESDIEEEGIAQRIAEWIDAAINGQTRQSDAGESPDHESSLSRPFTPVSTSITPNPKRHLFSATSPLSVFTSPSSSSSSPRRHRLLQSAGSVRAHSRLSTASKSSNAHVNGKTNLLPSVPSSIRASILAAATTESVTPSPCSRPSTSASSLNGHVLLRPSTGNGNGNGSAASASSSSSRSNRHNGSHSARTSTAPSPIRHNADGGGSGSGSERYDRILSSLQNRLAMQERKVHQLRSALNEERASKTSLQQLFAQCVQAVKEQVAARVSNSKNHQPLSQVNVAGSPPPYDPRSIPDSSLTASDRAAMLEWLLAQPAVHHVIFQHMFPPQAASSTSAPPSSMPSPSATQANGSTPKR